MSAKQGKLLRAEPIAQQMIEDRVRLRGAFVPGLENEWATWQPSDQDSPGRIDASCVLVHGLIPEANKGAIVHAPLPTSPIPGTFAGRAGVRCGGSVRQENRQLIQGANCGACCVSGSSEAGRGHAPRT
ncbi:hypothetical protein [Streptomyces sp. NPDC047841]|uniref:hypothetical protein n=1 Tax=Streptomyces sp. NPDC047841 TaxID=3154708 RepID=UPI003454EE06